MKKKILTTIIALNLLVAALASHLGINRNISNNKTPDLPNNSYSYETESKPQDDIIINPNTSEEEQVIVEKPSYYENISLSEYDKEMLNMYVTSDYSHVLEDIYQIKVDYLYSELYTGDYNLEVPEISSAEDSLIINNQVNYDALYNKVLSNNEKYLNENNVNNYKNTTTSLVSKVCRLITDELNDILANNTTLDRIELNNKLNSLKIFSYEGFSYGFFDQTKTVLGVNLTALSNESNEVANEIICHEIVHLVQGASEEELENSNHVERQGYCYTIDDNTYNPYNWTWFIEACAEEYSYKYNNLSEPFVYSSEIQTLEAMKLATFSSGNEFSESLYSSDINTLYKIFNCTTEEEKKEIQQMFYALTIYYNDDPGFEGIHFFNSVYPQVGTEKLLNIRSELRGTACLTMSKFFYKNLALKIDNKSVCLEDIFKVISIYELEMSRQLWYDTEYEDLQVFYEGYVNVQNVFFANLANALGVETSYIKELYYAYNKEVEITNISIPWLSNDENEYLNYINESRAGNKRDAIFKYYEEKINPNMSR